MGFNIAGFVCDDNFDKDLKKLSSVIGINLELVEEINFETASSNWTTEGDYNVHFTDNGTIMFVSHDIVAGKQLLPAQGNAMWFAYSATSMAFIVQCRLNDKHRYIMEFNHEKKISEGDVLDLETEHPTADGLTFALLDEILGEPYFGGIDMGATSYRCKKVSQS